MDGLPRLRDLGLGVRAGLTLLLLTLLGGLAASATHLVLHHENRDSQPGLSLDDLTGAYHGVSAPAPLRTALERGHPDDLPAAERELLERWLGGDKISERYDDLDLGDDAPAEVLTRRCVSCHARQAEAGEGIGQTVPLEYWDDVKKLAFARELVPTPTEIVIASAHTHALGMGTLSILVGLLALASRWPRSLVGGLVFLCGLGLFCDLGAWLPARSAAGLVPVLAVAGGVWITSSAALLALVLAELWLPARPRS